MKKRIVMVLVVFSMVLFGAFSDGGLVTDINGEDWSYMSEEQQTFFVMGAMVASGMNMETLQTLRKFEDISQPAADVLISLNEMSVQVGYIMSEIDRWYNETREWNVEVMYVLFGAIGNLDRFGQYLDMIEKTGGTKDM